LNAKTVIEFVVFGGIIPALAAIVVFFAIGWSWPRDVAHRYRMAASFALSVLIGVVLLPSTKTLLPSQFWEWIPYLGLIAAFVAGLTRADGVARGERWGAVYLLAVISAWMIVPQWPELSPAWPIQAAVLAAGMILVTALVVPLPARLPGRWLPIWLMLTAATLSVLVLDNFSESFGVLAALPAGALAGCGIAASLTREPADLRALALPYAVVVGGYAFVCAVYPTTPLWPLVAVPLAPVALWLSATGPLAKLTGVRSLAAQGLCVVIPLIIVAALLWARSNAVADDW
jgi:hypothetical protein